MTRHTTHNQRISCYRRFLAVLAIAIASTQQFACQGRGPEPPSTKSIEKEVALQILVDLSRSLNENQRIATWNRVVRLCEETPEGGVIQVRAIATDSDLRGAIQPALERDSGARTKLDEQRLHEEWASKCSRVGDAVKRQFEEAAKNEHLSRETCILNAFLPVREFLTDYPSSSYRRTVLFISDMIEDCSRDGRQIILSKERVDKETKWLESNGEEFFKDIGFPVGTADILVLFPEGNTLSSDRHPSRRQLERFWRGVFSMSGLLQEGRSTCDFRTSLPTRLWQPLSIS